MQRSNDSTKNPQSDALKMVDLKEQKKEKKKKSKIFHKTWFWVLCGVLGFFILFFLPGLIFGLKTAKKLESTQTNLKATLAAVQEKDLKKANQALSETGESLSQAHTSFQKTKFYKYIPFLGKYWQDVDHIFSAGDHALKAGEEALNAIEPYADILGFTGADVEQVAQSAEERLIFLAETAKKLEPKMGSINEKIKLANTELAQINPKRYPENLFGQSVRPQIKKLQETTQNTADSLAQFRPLFQVLPELLGNPEPQKYLLLFQNDAELRPTGGFMTAYATLNVLKGKLEPGISQDIYTLDNNFKGNVPAPDPIKKFLPLVYTWNLRDMNLSPDFKTSMDTFTKYYNQAQGSPEVDAIIAIDTQVPVRLLEILGPVGVPGYGGKFSAKPDDRCDGCPQVIYALENIITRPTYEIRKGRKSILGPLMNSMLANMMGSPKKKWPEFFNTFTSLIKEKHLLMYFFDETKQETVEALQAAGRIRSYDGDYLHINDTNFAGAKSNLFVEPEAKQEITLHDDGSLTKTLTLTYKNPAPPSNCNLEAGELCLNGVLRDWIRLYVPKGSTLISSKGSEIDITTEKDLGKTVFAGFFTIAPESVKKLEFKYKTPPIIKDQYKLLIQKQPGKKIIPHTIILDQTRKEIELKSDTEINF